MLLHFVCHAFCRNLRADILGLSRGRYIAPQHVGLCFLIAVSISLQLVSLICADQGVKKATAFRGSAPVN
jgi:hypothetical protein